MNQSEIQLIEIKLLREKIKIIRDYYFQNPHSQEYDEELKTLEDCLLSIAVGN